jgi:hypothetical protein
VDNITTVVNDYQERLRRMQVVPLFSHKRRMLRQMVLRIMLVQPRDDYHLHLAHYMFVARCRAEGVAPLTQFLYLVAKTDWSQFHASP